MGNSNPEQLRAPIWNALKRYQGENNLRFHMPGHIGGRGMADTIKDLAQFDITELPGTDDIHLPKTCIKEACQLMADAFGAKESFFLVNGATSGIHALLLSLPGKQARLLLPRNAHRSFWGGMVMSGAWPEYLPVSYHFGTGLPMALDPAVVAHRLVSEPAPAAVFLTSPNYFGVTCKIAQVAEECRKKKVLLCVDEAHGSHLCFHPTYPPPALSQGAQAVVNGLHKTLPVLNPGACLHISGEFPYRDRLVAAHSLLTTTSPSFPLLASIDNARAFMIRNGYRYLNRALDCARKYRCKINQLPGLRVLDQKDWESHHGMDQDPLKLVIILTGLTIDGFQMAKLLLREYGIQPEHAEESAVLFMMSMFHQEDEWERLLLSLKEISFRFNHREARMTSVPQPPQAKVVLSPRQAFGRRLRTVRFNESLGEVCGEMIAPYPPGIPCLLPGEMINAEILEYLCYIKQRNISVHGAHDTEIDYIRIIDDRGGLADD